MVTDRDKIYKRTCNVSCKNKDVDVAMMKVINDRNDDWAIAVKGRIEFVNDLHAEDAIYHIKCNSYFRTRKSNPVVQGDTSRKRGRPVDTEKEEVFLEVAEFLGNHNDEQFTLSEIVKMMDEKLNSSEAYTAKWLRKRLQEYFEEKIIFTSTSGKYNVITFAETVSKILHDFKK